MNISGIIYNPTPTLILVLVLLISYGSLSEVAGA